jgi:hypothetical protein
MQTNSLMKNQQVKASKSNLCEWVCSLWDYTHVVMNFLCGKCGTNGGIPRDDEWLSYFDIVVTGRSVCTSSSHLCFCKKIHVHTF